MKFSYLPIYLFLAPLVVTTWCSGQEELRLEAIELGDEYAAAGNWAGALDEYEAVLSDRDELSRRAYRKIGVVHLRKARAYQVAKQYGPARVEADFALDLFRRYRPEWVPSVHNLRAGLALATGDLFDALAAYNAGLGAFHVTAPASLPRPHPDSLGADQLAEATLLLGGRARLLAGSDQALEALADYELLFNLQDLRGTEVAFIDDRTFLNLGTRVYYDRAIDLLAAYHADTGDEALLWDAFKLSQRARRQDLLHFLRRERAGRDTRERQLRDRIADLKGLEVAGDRGPDLEAAELALDRLLHVRPKAQLAQPGPVAGRELLPILTDRGRGLALFHFGEEAGHLFLLKPGARSIHHRAITDPRRATTLVRDFRVALDKGRENPDDLSYVGPGCALYELLFGDSPDGDLGLMIVPDGPVRALPFAGLPATEREEIFLDRPAFLGGEAGVVYVQHPADLLREDSRNTSPYEIDLLAIHPGISTPGWMAELFPNNVTAGGDRADREYFLAEAGRARIVHLAAATDPDGRALWFTPDGRAAPPERSLLLADVTTMDLRAELVAAPGTGLPPPSAGGGSSIDLPTALAAAGARSSITTLWPVTGEEVMREFYAELALGRRRDEALLSAQAERRGRLHPYFWSGYRLYGSALTLVPAKVENSQVWYWLGGLALVLVGVASFRIRKSA